MNITASADRRTYDVVVWGASGFTGRLVVEYLAANYPQGGELRWAAAGRNAEKLARVLNDVAGPDHGIPILIADSDDSASLRSMVTASKAILTTVGPYALYGSALVEACAENGTHYCDLSGEPQWMRKMIDRYQSLAEASGARIVHSCGFDSIPSDLGVWFMQREAQRIYGETCNRIRMLVRVMKGGASGGTIASMTQAMDEARADRAVARILVDSYALNPEGDRQGPDERDQTGVVYDDDAAAWTAPFVMAGINTKIVRRSNALTGYPYGRDFRYSEAVMTGPGPAGWTRATMMTAGLGAFMLANSFSTTRSMLVSRLVPKPGDGPSRRERENGFFKLLFFGRFPDGKSIRTTVTGDRDPGYGSTSKMLGESAVCLARDSLMVGGGFWTPSSAMGEALFERLVSKAGLTFEIA